MSIDLSTHSIASVAYRTSITDRSLLNIILRKENNNVILQINESKEKQKDSIITSESGRSTARGVKVTSGQPEKIWEDTKTYPDTSSLYRKPYKHLGLWSRINCNSSGSLPKQIDTTSVEEIKSSDSSTITSYLTPSRGVRKCSLTVFAACSRMASRSIGYFKDSEKHAYSCQPIKLSVKELSKNTHAGTDTLGKKNDITVQKRVIKQIIDIHSRPTSRKLFKNNISVVDEHDKLRRMMNLPELIFHRFQATYKPALDKCVEKSRIVWAVPYTIVALENIYIGEIIKKVKSEMKLLRQCIYPIGLTNYEIGQRSVRTLRESFSLLEGSDYKIYSLDFKKKIRFYYTFMG
jgi:hypothetical protein